MATIRLQISEKVLDKVLWLLGHFSKDEVEIIEEDLAFIEQKEFVQKELDRMDKGEVDFVSMEEMNRQVRALISKHEAQR
ncbi:MAG: hypothetical protein NWQ55_07870 [Salibacteraceae bacterium]|jgi:hypothetical protein|nr:hypothetical protein [Salibacteraceae bacterium]MDP4843652.1 hypothetical protein [Salibacteraceae bacterium]MDP4934665.1 hypothetical protein [Salibacteraceae bacterium]MDP4964973.1 hypothetical protein [Salibacteraceae bacterium]